MLGIRTRLIHFVYVHMSCSLQLASPQIMKLLQSFNANSNDDDQNNDPELWKGYFYASLLLVVTMFTTFLNAKYVERMAMLGMKIQTTLVSAIYRKSLKLSGAARKESSTGTEIQDVLMKIS